MSHIRGAQRDVEQFHRATGQGVGEAPAMPDRATRQLRASLIAEEVAETLSALGFDVSIVLNDPSVVDQPFNPHIRKLASPSLVEVADGIADSIYVELGTAVAAGIDMEPVWEAVQMSNIAKASGPVREDGKRLKPEGWVPPDIEAILRRQGGCAFGCCETEEAS